MFIKSIDLENFKSYYGPNKIELNAKFNVITGPAGSGKSNVIDAISRVINEGKNYNHSNNIIHRSVYSATVSITFDKNNTEFKCILKSTTNTTSRYYGRPPHTTFINNNLDQVKASTSFITFEDIKKVLSLKSHEILEMVKKTVATETRNYEKEQEEILKYIKIEEGKLNKLRTEMNDKLYQRLEQLQTEALSPEIHNKQDETELSLLIKQLMDVRQQLSNVTTEKNKAIVQLESYTNEYTTRKNKQTINSGATFTGPLSDDSFLTELRELIKPEEQMMSLKQKEMMNNVESSISDYVNMMHKLECQSHKLNLIMERLKCKQEKELENLEKEINNLKEKINSHEEFERKLEEKVKNLEDKVGNLQNIRNDREQYKIEEDNPTTVREDIEFTAERIRTLRNTILHLDILKDVCETEAYIQISINFGSIFNIMLPGAKAKLVPPRGKTIIDGLTIEVYLNGVWIESLEELNGSQRRLAAFSLILAVSLYKPADIYILDDVDKYLDLFYARNFHHVIKTHFEKSQFIVVSKLDGMFNNANALFKTEMIKDGVTTITKTKN